jgi:two-component system response regulator HydG
MRFRVLIAEDEQITLKHLLYALKEEGYEAEGVSSGQEAWKKARHHPFDAIIIADIKIPGMTGLELLKKVKDKFPETEVLIITGFGSIDSAVEAMKQGAFDYITKPFDLDEFLLKVKKIENQKRLRTESQALKAILGMNQPFPIIAKSRAMRKVLELVESIKDSDCNVLLIGESGVGKNLLARLIHSISHNRNKPYMSINCATLTEELLASELFGHEKGSFTGAVSLKLGLIEVAEGGTVFLDEISEMTPTLQAKLLKVIEENEFFRVGGTKPIKVHIRFIAATNQDVHALISKGRFREDLYYRLNVMEIFIPALRERRKDIEPLSNFFLHKQLPRYHKKIEGFTREAMEILKQYSFPGNVRELENIIERAAILEKSGRITSDSLPQTMKLFQIETVEPGKIKTIEELSRDYAEQVIQSLGGNKSKAAEVLGISRTSLWRLLKGE